MQRLFKGGDYLKDIKSIHELKINDLYINKELEKYKVNIDNDSTVGSVIYKHLSSKPGFIRHKREVNRKKELETVYSDAIHKVVAKGAPMEIFISAFQPKVTNPNVTNGLIYPDMSDFLTMMHLHLIAKGIREVYDYGFRFIIGYKGQIFKDFFNWSQHDVDKTYETLLEFKDIVENIVGIHNAVTIVRNEDLIEAQGKEFQVRYEEEISSVKEKYERKDAYYLRKIDAWTNDFRKALDVSTFSTIEELDSFLLDNAIKLRALRNIEYFGGKYNLGICNEFPNVLRATIRGLDENLSFQLNPFFRFHSHQRLIVLTKEDKWHTLKWSEMKELTSNFEEVYVNEFDYPFYFKEI